MSTESQVVINIEKFSNTTAATVLEVGVESVDDSLRRFASAVPRVEARD